MKRPAPSVSKLERTDHQLIDALHRLSLPRQKELTQMILAEAAAAERVLPYNALLQDERIRIEASRLTRESGIQLSEFAEVINPGVYSSYFARSWKCTMAKMTRVEDGEGPADVVVDVKVYEELIQRHRLLPAESFAIHIIFGAITLRRSGHTEVIQKRRTVEIPPDSGELVIYARPGAWFKYVPHPLAAWIAGM